MWIWMALASAVLLGLYDVAKKAALKHNGTYWILFVSTALCSLLLLPFLSNLNDGCYDAVYGVENEDRDTIYLMALYDGIWKARILASGKGLDIRTQGIV